MSMINVLATNIMGAGNYFGNGLTFNARSYGDTILQGNYGIGPLTANINADGNAQILGNYFDQQINPMWFPYAGQPAPQPQYYPQPVPQPIPYPMPYAAPSYQQPSYQPSYSPMPQYGGISTYANAIASAGSGYGMPSYGAPSYGTPSYNMPQVLYPAAQNYGSSVSSAVAGPGAYGSGVAGYPAIARY